jgi:hypothetical protein
VSHIDRWSDGLVELTQDHPVEQRPERPRAVRQFAETQQYQTNRKHTGRSKSGPMMLSHRASTSDWIRIAFARALPLYHVSVLYYLVRRLQVH